MRGLRRYVPPALFRAPDTVSIRRARLHHVTCESKSMDDLTKDVRLLRRNLAKGFMSQDTMSKLLADLPDVSDRAEWVDHEIALDDDDD